MLEVKEELNERLPAILRRNEAVQKQLRGGDGRMDEVGEDRANWLDNDEAPEASGEAGRQETETIKAALARVDAGTWNPCSSCGKDIPPSRLKALPYSTRCAGCAS
jgi:RNA polymerase-binding transcription factor DksA